MSDFLFFAVVGFLAQLVDGALGMGFGVISSAILFGSGVAPPLVSATVNAAKIPTGFVAGLSHWRFRNIDPALLRTLAIGGILGGVAGGLTLTHLKGGVLTLLISAYLIFMGTTVILRGIRGRAPRTLRSRNTAVIGAAGGLIEGIGGSWGPVVTPALTASGVPPNRAIGSGAVAELFVSIAVFATLAVGYFAGSWAPQPGRGLMIPVLGLLAGGVPAAVFGGWLASRAPRRPLTIGVGLLALSIGIYRLIDTLWV
ncbi:sulfite exporter TauE/SafE family protein [Tropicimonas aquimaris]|uniref:Probable membrane transporter protein n=1 Tax=Tropicimonas aquimaris TaxID=914152 RepID=A0ABW3IIY6_9RHOB